MLPSTASFFTDTVRAAAGAEVVVDSEPVAAVVEVPPDPVSVFLLSPQAAMRPPRASTATPVISKRRPTVVRMDVLLEVSLVATGSVGQYVHVSDRDCLVSGDRAASRPPDGSLRGT